MSTRSGPWPGSTRGAADEADPDLSWVRAGLIPLLLLKIVLDRSEFPPGYEAAAWATLGAETIVAGGLVVLAYTWKWRLRGSPSSTWSRTRCWPSP